MFEHSFNCHRGSACCLKNIQQSGNTKSTTWHDTTGFQIITRSAVKGMPRSGSRAHLLHEISQLRRLLVFYSICGPSGMQSLPGFITPERHNISSQAESIFLASSSLRWPGDKQHNSEIAAHISCVISSTSVHQCEMACKCKSASAQPSLLQLTAVRVTAYIGTVFRRLNGVCGQLDIQLFRLESAHARNQDSKSWFSDCFQLDHTFHNLIDFATGNGSVNRDASQAN
jgi:hypothetical protein